jgi:hypothetical protein
MTFFRDTGLSTFSASPADIGAARNENLAGNFTVGMRFQFMRPCIWTGVRFFANYVGSKTWKVRAWNATDSVSLGIKTGPSVPQGTHTILFDTPIVIADATDEFKVSAYDTAGLVYAAMLNTRVPALNVAGLLAPNLWLLDDSMYSAGDPGAGVDPIATSGSTSRMAVEPVFFIP